MTYPRSPYDKLGELVYFPRMLDKIRLKRKGRLSDYYFPLLGKGFDGRLCSYLGIPYEKFVELVHAGESDEAILAWTQENGNRLTQDHIDIWNGFSCNRGWNDSGSPTLTGFKQELGIIDRHDIQTFFHFIEVDEKRLP